MKFFLPSITLFGLPLGVVLRMAKSAGFDGVEIFLIGWWNEEKVARLRELADKLRLDLRFHQAWSCVEGHKSGLDFQNKLLTNFGWLPRNGYSLNQHIPENACPTVVYADRWFDKSITGLEYQIISACGKDGKLIVPLDTFREMALKYHLPLVFDTQHILEYRAGRPGVDNILLNQDEIARAWEEEWHWAKNQVTEIHFNDWDPGHGELSGRNLFAGKGVAPLEEFVRILRRSGWRGIVTPEVKPKLPIPLGIKELVRIRQRMDYYLP